MKIEIELTPKEITKIVLEHLQLMFPGKYFMGRITSYGISFFVAMEKTAEEEELNANTKNQ